MSESKFQKRLKNQLEDCGAKVFNVHGHSMQERGWPDLYVAHKDFHGWLELKYGGGKLSTIQRIRIKELLARKVPAGVVRQLASGITTLEDVEGTTLTTLGRNHRSYLTLMRLHLSPS